MGIRHGFGLWLQPLTQGHDWTRETYALAMAIQNLSWGVFGVFVGMVADRFGAFRVLIAGALVYALGLLGMAYAQTPLMLSLSAGALIGIAQAGTTYAVVYGVIGRNVPAERRLPVRWNPLAAEEQRRRYPVQLRIEVLDRVGVLKDILTRLSDHRINVSDARVRTNPGKPARIDLRVELLSAVQLRNTMDQIRSMADVLDIARTGIG